MVRMMVGTAWVVACVAVAACDSGETPEPTRSSTLLGPGGALGEPGGGIGQTSGALSAAQCNYFAVDDAVTLCHAANLKKGKYVVVRTNEEGCVNGHAGHEGDFVSLDGTCDNDMCLPVGAPADDTIACCDNMEVVDGACACVAGYEAADGALTCTPIETVDCPGACGELTDRLLQECLTAFPPFACEALVPVAQDGCEAAGCSCEPGCDELAETLFEACVELGGSLNDECGIAAGVTRTFCRDSFCEPPPDPCAEPVCGDGRCCPGEDVAGCPECAPSCEEACHAQFQQALEACEMGSAEDFEACHDAAFQELDACVQPCFPDPCAEPVCGDGRCCPGEDVAGCPECAPSCEEACHAQFQQALEACEMGSAEDFEACHNAAFQELDACVQPCFPDPCAEPVCGDGVCCPGEDVAGCPECVPSCEEACHAELQQALEACEMGPPEDFEACHEAAFQQLDACVQPCFPDPCAEPVCGDGVCCPEEDVAECPECAPTCEDECHAQLQQALEACEMGPAEDLPVCHDAAFQQEQACFEGCCFQRCLDHFAPELDGCADGTAPPEHCEMIIDECHMMCGPPPDPCAAPVCGDGVCCSSEDIDGCPEDCTPRCEDGCHEQLQQAMGACEMGPPEDFSACHDAAFQELEACLQGCCVQQCLDRHAPDLEGCADGTAPPAHCEMVIDECDLMCEPPPNPCDEPTCGDGTCCLGEDIDGCPEDCTPTCEDGCHAHLQQALEACEMGPAGDPACHDAAHQQFEACLQACFPDPCAAADAGCGDGVCCPGEESVCPDCGPPPDPCVEPVCGDQICCVVAAEADCVTDCQEPCQAVCQDCTATGLTPEDCELVEPFCAPFCAPVTP